MEKGYIPFSKYHALGNHFVIVDNRAGRFQLDDPEFIRQICNPRTGVGADCLLEMIPCSHGNHPDCCYEIVNHVAKGFVGRLCGNGSRCMAAFASRKGISSTEKLFNSCAADGVHWAKIQNGQGTLVQISIKDIENVRVYDNNNSLVNSGSPSHVQFVKSVTENFDIQSKGDEIRFDKTRYPEGVNVMFIQESGPGEITMRSYERTIDAETWSCGTGSVAAAIAAEIRQVKFNKSYDFKMTLITRLGKLKVQGTRLGEMKFQNLSLIGPVCHVFDGEYIFSGQ